MNLCEYIIQTCIAVFRLSALSLPMCVPNLTTILFVPSDLLFSYHSCGRQLWHKICHIIPTPRMTAGKQHLPAAHPIDNNYKFDQLKLPLVFERWLHDLKSCNMSHTQHTHSVVIRWTFTNASFFSKFRANFLRTVPDLVMSQHHWWSFLY